MGTFFNNLSDIDLSKMVSNPFTTDSVSNAADAINQQNQQQSLIGDLANTFADTADKAYSHVGNKLSDMGALGSYIGDNTKDLVTGGAANRDPNVTLEDTMFEKTWSDETGDVDMESEAFKDYDKYVRGKEVSGEIGNRITKTLEAAAEQEKKRKKQQPTLSAPAIRNITAQGGGRLGVGKTYQSIYGSK